MTILQLNPPIPLETPKGAGQAHFLVDYSLEQDLFWIVFLDDTGQSWMFPNHQIRADKNISIGRCEPEKLKGS